jgi:RNA polymerase sigma-70 factor (ECF subfamily)
MLRDDSRRPAGGTPGLPFAPPEPTRYGEPQWLEPYPDLLLDGIPDRAPGPEARYETREAVSLAFMMALQRLPPRQRAVLVLRDVLGYSAAEVAEMLETTPVSINSALVRARASIEERGTLARERAALPASTAERDLLAAFADAFEAGDTARVLTLLTDDAWVTMPPEPFEYQGHAAIGAFFRHVFEHRLHDQRRLIATRANDQPAFAFYSKDPRSDVARILGVLVLTLEGDRIARITRFQPGGVLPHFALPRAIPL